MLFSLGFAEEDCAKCLRRLIRVIDGHGCAEAQTARDDRMHEAAPPTPGSPTDLPSPNNLFLRELQDDTEHVTSCRDLKGQSGVNEEPFPVTPPLFKGPSIKAGAGDVDGTALITGGDLTPVSHRRGDNSRHAQDHPHADTTEADTLQGARHHIRHGRGRRNGEPGSTTERD